LGTDSDNGERWIWKRRLLEFPAEIDGIDEIDEITENTMD
jgi:hypothetical protein